MANEGDGEEAPRETPRPDAGTGDEETADVLRSGPKAGNRAGGLAFLALLALLAAALLYYVSGTGSDSFLARLDSDLLTHAELTLAANEKGNRLAVVPAWPLRLYATLRRDIAVYAGAAILAALLWSWSARARARRDVYLAHEKLSAEIAELRRRLDDVEKKS